MRLRDLRLHDEASPIWGFVDLGFANLGFAVGFAKRRFVGSLGWWGSLGLWLFAVMVFVGLLGWWFF
jgi:hypothetical protein